MTKNEAVDHALQIVHAAFGDEGDMLLVTDRPNEGHSLTFCDGEFFYRISVTVEKMEERA